MGMELKHMALISVLTTISEVQSLYYVSNSKYRWDSQTKECDFATPTLNFSGNELSVDLPIDLKRNENIWIGYYRNLTMFEYTGCMLTEGYETKHIPKNSPGNCFSSCGTRYRLIGLSNNKCYCLDRESKSNSQVCEEKCMGMTDVVCGSNTSMSVYKVAYGRAYSGHGNCLRMERTGGESYNWFPCIEYNRIICTLENTTVTDLEINNLPWSNASKRCFERNASPTSLGNAYNVTNYFGTSWTGVLRSTAIYSYSAYDSALPNNGPGNVDFMYVGNNGIVQFDSAAENMKILCYRNNETTTIEYVTPAESRSTTSLQQTIISQATAISSDEKTSSFSLADFTTKGTLDGNSVNRDKNIGVPVGVSVSVLIVVGIVITVFMIWRRRKLNSLKDGVVKKTSKLSGEGPNSCIHFPENNLKNVNIPLRYSKEECQDNDAHTYHVLEKKHNTDNGTNNIFKNSSQTESHYNYPDMTDCLEENVNNQFKDIEQGQYAHTYFVLEEHRKDADFDDGTYNVTGAHKPKTGHETDNVYNKLDDENHATYDHIPGSASNRNDSDNTYDTRENAINVLKLDGEPSSVYNHLSGVEDSGTYDH